MGTRGRRFRCLFSFKSSVFNEILAYHSGGSRPSDKGGGGGLRASFCSKNMGGGPGPLAPPPPQIRHCIKIPDTVLFFSNLIKTEPG